MGGVEKPKLSKMLVEGSNRRIFTVDKHSGMCVSGLMADARQVVSYAREEANSYQDFYGGVIPGNVLCDRVASLMHIYTLNWQVRPFGANALLASLLRDGDGQGQERRQVSARKAQPRYDDVPRGGDGGGEDPVRTACPGQGQADGGRDLVDLR